MSNSSTMKLTDQNNKPLSERVADQIINFIRTDKLQPGEKLPNEFDLASQLQVGRGSVREAVKLLVARNVLTIRRGKGTFIANHVGEAEDPLGLSFCPDRLQLALDLLEVRMQLEPWVAANAAIHASEEDCRNLLKKCNAVEQDILNGIDHLKSDKAFHRAIANCTHNLVMPKLIPVIVSSVDLFGTLTKGTLTNETKIYHQKITEAILAKNPQKAEEAMLQHLLINRDAIYNIKAGFQNT